MCVIQVSLAQYSHFRQPVPYPNIDWYSISFSEVSLWIFQTPLSFTRKTYFSVILLSNAHALGVKINTFNG